MFISLKDGKIAVRLARDAIEKYIKDGIIIEPIKKPPFDKKMGVFVTINKNGDLRGCIGYPYPIKELGDAIVDSAISAATQDPRFPPVRADELDQINLEVTILSEPQRLNVKDRKDLPKMIKIGQDGLIVKKGFYQGLLLPQVPIEWEWDPEEFLCQTCFKAGLPPDCWLDKDTEIYKFEGQIFEEEGDDVVEKKFKEDLS
ncbi:MAG TPA: TIGR00296 family protein [Halobacteria archaeon]|jgi:uncharacterized protein (TIGR00296 family)|nr:TIGR00296 family protein [Halobacteria archaeon]HIH78494.1 TIGR00296 family protein [Halobacteria archaeon]